jgi:exonuclease SbcD
MPDAIRILLLADSHLGLDLPTRPRVERRRRGHDFLANYALALAPALAGEVDLVVHAGDVFDRPSVVPTLAYQAFEPLRRIAERGVPVFIVPGNHERSRLPHARFAVHPRIHVFDRPRTFAVQVRGHTIALAGFPYERHDVRGRFPELIEASGWNASAATHRLLCLHHCVEGATVGPADYRFTTADDVVRHADIPAGFAAVLTGHIHRHQVLTTNLAGHPLHVPVLYPGSIERTALAEIDEVKGYMLVQLPAASGGRLQWKFRPLPARPMLRAELSADALAPDALDAAIRALVDAAPPDAVLAIRVTGALSDAHWPVMSSTHLRTFVPATMNVEVVPADRVFTPYRRNTNATPAVEEQLSF